MDCYSKLEFLLPLLLLDRQWVGEGVEKFSNCLVNANVQWQKRIKISFQSTNNSANTQICFI